MKNKNLRWLWLSLAVIILDQLTKSWVVQRFAVGESRPVNSMLNITLAHNAGSAFSFLSQAGGWQRWFFIILVIVVSIVILVWLARLHKTQHFQSCALALILGGALGNLWDRLRLGYVNDFVDFHVSTWHFATFNIADSAITIGVIMLLLTLLAWKK